ncbi:MAG: type II secretion system protein GspG [Planctomycetota bacterium]|jgi:hypothetical protein
MLFSLIAAAAVALPPAAQVDDPARLVPSNTLVYFGTHSVRDGASASANSAMRMILGEPEVKAFLEKPVSAADKVLNQMLQEGGIESERAQRLSLAQMMSGEGDSAPIGKVFVALTHIGMPTEESQPPDVGLVVGMELLEGDDLGLVRALWSRIELPEETSDYKGREVFVKAGPEGMNISLTFVDNLAIASLSTKSMEAVLDRAAGSGADSLAASADYAKLVLTSGGLEPGSSTWMMRTAALSDVARGLLAMAMSEADKTEELAMVGAILDGLGLSGLTWMGGVDYRDLSGRVHGTTCVEIDTSAQGLLPRLVAAGKPLDPSLPSRVPVDTLGMGAGSIDWLPEVYDFVMNSFEAIEPDAYAEVQGTITELMGESDLRNDLLANVHGTVLSYSVPGEGITEAPASIFRFKVRDSEKFVTALGTLVSSVGMMAMGSDAVQLKESDHEGQRLFEIDISRTPMAAMMMQPAFAIDGEEIVFGLQSTKALKTALNFTGEGETLSNNGPFMAFIEQLSAKGDLSSMSFTDNARSFAAGYTQVAGAAQMLATGASDLPVDLALMPSEQAITKHLAHSYTGSYVADDGRMHVYRSEGQFQLGDFLPIVATGAILGIAMAEGTDVFAAEAAEEDPYETVQKHLAEISAGMTVYKIAEGEFPGAISDLIKPLADYPQGCLGKTELPLDPWGQPYNFRLNAKGRPFLWSSGPDGADQGGEGDDIAKG